MTFRLLTIAAAGALAAGTATAGSIDPAPVEPVVPPPMAAPAPAGVDWTGFYTGGQLGYANVDTDGAATLDGSGAIGGLTLGYDHDFGGFVAGAGIDYDWADVDVGGATTLENVARLKLRAGPKIGGSGLLYASGGAARAETDTLGTSNGWFLGAGYEQMLTDRFSLGAEALWHQFDDFNDSGIDVDATTLQLRGTFRF